MNKSVKGTIEAILFILIIAGFIYIGSQDFSHNLEVDNEKFDRDYPLVNKDNVFKYVNASEVYSKLKTGASVIFMGYPSNNWTGYYASILNDVAKEVGLKEISYYDFYDDKRLGNAVYQSIVLRLNAFLPTTDNNNQDIYAPTLLIVKNGEILYYDNETAIREGTITPEEYWTEFNKNVKKNSLRVILKNYVEEVK